MNKKIIIGATLTLAIGFLILGVIFKKSADRFEGMDASAGIVQDGVYTATSTGRIGADQEKYEMFDNGGTIFYILSGVSGAVCVAAAVSGKKKR